MVTGPAEAVPQQLKLGMNCIGCLCNYSLGSSKGIIWGVGAGEPLPWLFDVRAAFEKGRERPCATLISDTPDSCMCTVPQDVCTPLSLVLIYFKILEKDFFFLRKRAKVIPFRLSFYSFDFNKNLIKMCYSGSS